MTTFDSGFLWGAATAGHQVEGNNVLSDIWAMEHVPGSPFREPSGDACDSYHRYDEDIALLAAAGLNTYRFSIEWSRIEPEPGLFSRAELDHYLRVAQACIARGVTPLATLNHFTTPAWFARDGAWDQAAAPELFERYTRHVVAHLGDVVAWWATFNEPNAGAMLAATGSLPLGALDDSTELGKAQIQMATDFAHRVSGEPGVARMGLPVLPGVGLEHVFEAHRRARSAIKAISPSARVGWTISMADYQSVDGGEANVARVLDAAIYPFLEQSKGDDYIGVQTYTRTVYNADGVVQPPATANTAQTGWEYYPAALAATTRLAHEYTGVPVMVTENGIATADDELRIRYTAEALAGLLEAAQDGVPVLGYIHWTLLDNWEWHTGYSMTFGLIAVDRETFARSPKPSLAWLGSIASEDGAGLDSVLAGEAAA